MQQEIDRERQAQERLKGQAQSLETDLQKLKKSLVSAAQIMQDREFRVITLEAKIADLVRQENELAARLDANRVQLAGVLLALQRMVQFPPEALMALPESPDDLVRSAILLRAVVPEIERRADSIRFDLQALAQARRRTADERLNLTTASRDLDQQRNEIHRLMANKRKMLEQTIQESRRAADKANRLAAQAKSLKDLMARLDDQRRQDEEDARRESQRREEAKAAADAKEAKQAAERKKRLAAATVSSSGPIQSMRGRLPLPVVGDLVGRYGENLPTGLTRKGIDIAARRGSQVVATYAGKVAFAGKFRGYGQLLIIDHGGGYHTLLAGMAEIDAAVGQRVATGEPVGRMQSGADGADRPVLYVELRRKGQPINPMPWLTARNDKVSG
ncbi:MAG: peptidoglycan DD-metalloendopeptidase family protein [Rhodospirillaceae bacterium]